MDAIAIIGIGCRFPGAKDPQSFWQLLHNNVDAITEVPKDRWNIDNFYALQPATPGKMNTRWGGFLEQVDGFDASFFGISPREVERMDPQQRLLLEVAWESLENAAIVPSTLSGTQTGVFIAIGNYDYSRLIDKDRDRITAYDGTGNTLCIAANRLSYLLNLRGASVVIETACSSSLVALHSACQSLHLRESNLCLLGGVSLILTPEPTISYSQARMMASDGRCKTFDARADGYVRGEGCGVVVLKRLEDAIADGDNIQAIIRGSAVNQDGLSNGLTAPNRFSQQSVVRQALENASVTPAQISYVETHGTGTSLGDPIEVDSLKTVLMEGRELDRPCWIGSVKTNIGHLEAAAGMAGLIKVVLALQHQEIPAHLHLQQLNPYISLEGSSIKIPTENQPWSSSEKRLAGISAFGFGGTNAHVVLEGRGQRAEGRRREKVGANCRSPVQKEKGKSEEREQGNVLNLELPCNILTLSAKSEEALQDLVKSYEDYLTHNAETSIVDICFSANTGRSHFDVRLAAVAESSSQLREQLIAFATGKETSGLISGKANSKKPPKIAFLFTGQGSQYENMGRELYETQPTFRAALDKCAEILEPYLNKPLLEVIYPSQAEENIQSKIDETAYTQPALFAIEYALAQLWKSWGIEPAIAMGHSVGEYVAACVAGVFSLEDGLKLMAARGRLMQALPQDGEMVAVLASENAVKTAIQPYEGEISIAAINGSQSIVISGRCNAIEAVRDSLQKQGIKTKKLQVSHAFHSPLMEPMLAEFAKVAREITYSKPQIKIISNVTGQVVTEEIATPDYWCQHILKPVRFATSMETLQQQKCKVFVEIGAKPTLLGMGRQCLPQAEYLWLPSLRNGCSDWQQMLESLTQLYVRGLSVDWEAFHKNDICDRVILPTYPFQRQRYWVETTADRQALTEKTNLTPILNLLQQGKIQQLTQQLQTTEKLSQEEVKLFPKLLDLLVKRHQQQLTATSIQDWLYEVKWQRKPQQAMPHEKNGHYKPSSWLIFADRTGIGQTLAQLLRDRGHKCIVVYPQDIAPINPANLDCWFQELKSLALPLRGVVHLWGLDIGMSLEKAQVLGLSIVLHSLQAFVKHHPSSAARFWIVTRNAMPVDSSPPTAAQAPLWGLGKVMALEHPELWGGMLDLSAQKAENEAQQLLTEIEHSDSEDQIAFRNGQRYVPRLVRKQLPESQEITFRSDGTYLMTGGLGALGLKIAQWMVEQGAKHLILVGRSTPSPSAKDAIAQLEKVGAKVTIVQADISKPDDVEKILSPDMTPSLKGIIHAAGVLDDGILLQQDWERFMGVMAPKVNGAWNLHQLTQNLSLDFFVLFSSAASLIGSPSQGNYAAANAFMDILAHYRRSLGLPGLSINWGPWGDTGMAASLSSRDRDRLAAQGISAIAPEQGLQVLKRLLGQPLAQVGVLPFDWSVFAKQLSAGHQWSFFSELIAPVKPQAEVKPGSTQRQELLQRLQEAPASDRSEIPIAYLQSKVAKVLGLSLSHLDAEKSLFDLGLDSLMAVELNTMLRTELQVELPIRVLLEDPTIASIATLLTNQLMPDKAQTEAKATVLDLDAEAVLDPTIFPDNSDFDPTIEPTAILLTGATGFLGAYLLQELLDQTQADIYCLVRSPDLESGKMRLQNNLKTYDLWHEHYSTRIIPILGDLAQPHLGLSAELYARMAHQIDSIYHNGALLNYVYPYSKFKPINVLGTQEILRLACTAKVKPVHHVSSVAVFESSAYYGKRVTESDPIDRSEGIYLGYSQSKWVSERLVKIAGDRGLPVTIHRPPLVSGHSQTGLWNTDGFLCRMVKGCIELGSMMTDLDLLLDLSPVDYNSRAIVYLSRQKESLGKVFHLQNPHLLHWRELVDFICSMGYPLERVSFAEWQVRLSQAKKNPLYPLLPFFSHQWSDQQLTYLELNEQGKRPLIACEETLTALADSSIACPPLDNRLLKTYFSYLIRSGFLKAPLISDRLEDRSLGV